MDRAEEFLGAHPEVARIVEEIPKEGVIAVILFGSHATGKAGPLSRTSTSALSPIGLRQNLR
jgi:predicted nucleotidyltransferase